MSEFVNRMKAQRQLLKIVNRNGWPKEELFGLSRMAIDRWQSVNGIPRHCAVIELVDTASSKLFFLANKSQEQISEDYSRVSYELAFLAKQLALAIENLGTSPGRHVGSVAVDSPVREYLPKMRMPTTCGSTFNQRNGDLWSKWIPVHRRREYPAFLDASARDG